MAGFVFTEDEYQFIIGLEQDLLTRAQPASPRASSHFQKVAKMHTDFLAKEDGKRSTVNKKNATKATQDALRLKRQQERLAALQAAAQSRQQSEPQQGTPTTNQRTERSKAS